VLGLLHRRLQLRLRLTILFLKVSNHTVEFLKFVFPLLLYLLDLLKQAVLFLQHLFYVSASEGLLVLGELLNLIHSFAVHLFL
jgi:hypothetical protein